LAFLGSSNQQNGLLAGRQTTAMIIGGHQQSSGGLLFHFIRYSFTSLIEKIRELAKKLYVGNLTYETTEADLREKFAEFGPITSVTLIKDRETGASKGFAFVEMETQEGADQARQKLNNTMLNNRALKIDEARPADRSAGGSRGFSSGGRSGFGDRSGARGYGGGGGGGGGYGGGYGGKGGKKRGKKRGGGGGSANDYGGW
jgi:RNA recognition motif-containing protein